MGLLKGKWKKEDRGGFCSGSDLQLFKKLLPAIYGLLIYDEIINTSSSTTKSLDDFKEQFCWNDFKVYFKNINFNIEDLDVYFGYDSVISNGFLDDQTFVNAVPTPDTDFECLCKTSTYPNQEVGVTPTITIL